MDARGFEIALADATLPGRLYSAPKATAPRVLFVFAHGAGAGQASPFMQRYADALASLGVDVATFDFPYVAAGRKAPDRAPVLERAFLAAVDAAVAATSPRPVAVVVGGKSMGGRMATHLAAQPDQWTSVVPLVGAVVFGYPLTPPGARGGDRVSHLGRLAVPLLIVQGTRDTFGGPDAITAAVGAQPRLAVHPVPTGDHSLKVQAAGGRTQAQSDADVLGVVATWIRARLADRAR